VIIIFIAVGVVLFPIVSLFLLKESWKKNTHPLFVIWSWSIRILCLYPVRRMKNSKIPKGPYIIIANHSSYLDIFLMTSIFTKSPFLFLGKSELLKYPIIGIYFKYLQIPVFRDSKIKAAKSFIQAKNSVNNGWSLMIFPEGGIHDEILPQLAPFKEGAFKLAKNLMIPIIPVTFTKSYKLFSDPGNFFGGAHPGFVDVYIHDFISVEEIHSLSESELITKCFEIINDPILKLK
jgi:1-acyl-sn-glycerol-3-phosphate acyltransferase